VAICLFHMTVRMFNQETSCICKVGAIIEVKVMQCTFTFATGVCSYLGLGWHSG
jgi:hypothetical protein